MSSSDQSSDKSKMTRLNFLWMSLSSEPFVALYALLPFILAKDLKASALQISLFMSIRPILAVFAYYWDAYIHTRHPNLRKHLMFAWTFSFVPFLFFPTLKHLGYVLFAASLYQLFSKASMPPFFEICRQNLNPQERKKLISNTYLASFILSAVLGLFFGQILDKNPTSWKLASAIFALCALSSLYFQNKLSFKEDDNFSKPNHTSNYLFGPLKKSFHLLKSSQEYKNFQTGFMIGGSALMLIGPALSIFYADNLELSHKTYTQARYIFMSVGIVCSTPLWKKVAKHFSLNQLMPWVSMIFGLFPLVVLLAFVHKPILYGAFMFYGIAQAGSHLIWNLSSTHFAKDGDSTPYTALNILLQGIRGLFAPILGGVFTSIFGPAFVLILGSIIAFWGMYIMLKNNQKAFEN